MLQIDPGNNPKRLVDTYGWLAQSRFINKEHYQYSIEYEQKFETSLCEIGNELWHVSCPAGLQCAHRSKYRYGANINLSFNLVRQNWPFFPVCRWFLMLFYCAHFLYIVLNCMDDVWLGLIDLIVRFAVFSVCCSSSYAYFHCFYQWIVVCSDCVVRSMTRTNTAQFWGAHSCRCNEGRETVNKKRMVFN